MCLLKPTKIKKQRKFLRNKRKIVPKIAPKTESKSTLKRLAIQLGYIHKNECQYKPGMKLQKELADRDEDYLDFVRNFPCLVCGKPSVAHHIKTNGIGIKCSDYLSIPLCSDHHTSGKDAIHIIGKETFLYKFNLDLYREITYYLIEFIRYKNEIDNI